MDEWRRSDGQQRLVAHLRFNSFSPSVFKSFLRWWKEFRSVVTAPLLCWSSNDDDRFEHFVTRVGWKPFSEAICNDGITRRIFIHTIQDTGSDREQTIHFQQQLVGPVGPAG